MKRLLLLLVSISLFGQVFATDLETKLKQKVSPKFNGISISDVLNLFARQHALNLVVSGEVTGKVNVQLNDVTLADALNTILKSMGYHYIVENDVLMVKPYAQDVNGELVSKVFTLKYTNGFFVMDAIEPLLSSKGKMMPFVVQAEENEADRRASSIVVTDLWENLKQIE